jgi:hypothetical protein
MSNEHPPSDTPDLPTPVDDADDQSVAAGRSVSDEARDNASSASEDASSTTGTSDSGLEYSAPQIREQDASDTMPVGVYGHVDEQGSPGTFTRWGGIAAAVGFCLFLGAPYLAGLVGIRATSFENDQFAPAPNISLRRILNTDMYNEITAYATDRMPLRQEAISAAADINYRLFGDTPNISTVFRGLDGWLYLPEEFQRSPNAPLSANETLALWSEVTGLLEAAGKQPVFMIVPAKLDIEQQYLGPTLTELAQPALDQTGRMRRVLADSPPVGYNDLWAVLEPRRYATDGAKPEWLKNDTHWRTDAYVDVTRLLVNAVDPAMWSEDDFVVSGTTKVAGDLGLQAGLDLYDEQNIWTNRRPIDSRRSSFKGVYQTLESQVSPDAGAGTVLSGGSLLVLHDSFLKAADAFFPPYFSSVTMAEWKSRPAYDAEIVKAMRGADVVFLESADRGVWFRLLDGSLRDLIVVALSADLGESPLQLPADVTGWSNGAGGLSPTGDPDGILEVPKGVGVISDQVWELPIEVPAGTTGGYVVAKVDGLGTPEDLSAVMDTAVGEALVDLGFVTTDDGTFVVAPVNDEGTATLQIPSLSPDTAPSITELKLVGG